MIRSIRTQAAKLSRSHEFTWRYVANWRATLRHRTHPRQLSELSQHVLADLNRDGIAMIHVSDLLGDSSLFNELCDATEAEEKRKSEILDNDRALANEPVDEETGKHYVRSLLGERPVMDLDSVFVRFALQPQILRITNAYFGMVTRLSYFNVWHSFQSNLAPQASQLWHRDFDDLYCLMKVFVYLTDVDEGSGPLSYAPGTHNRGHIKREPECVSETRSARRTNDEQMSALIPENKWITGLGPKGTIVFADTHGYHKGGWVKQNERILYTSMYTSPAVQYAAGHERFVRPDDFVYPADVEASEALMPRR